MMKNFTLSFIIIFLLSSTAVFGQSGTVVEYEDLCGTIVLTYAGLDHGKHSYSGTDADLTVLVRWTGTQWEITITFDNDPSQLHFSSTAVTDLNPPNFAIGMWQDEFSGDTELVNLSGSGTASVLPVELISFIAVKQDRGIELQWQTASELNNEKFEIEMSQDGRRFQKIGEVKGYGTTQTQVDYDFQIEEPPVGLSYYRLKQMDFDGAFEYSEIVSVRFEEAGGSIGNIYPNPSQSGLVSLNLSTEESKVIPISVFDVSGKLISDQFRQLNRGDNRLDFDFSSLNAGIYIIEVGDEVNPIHRKLILN